MNEMKCVCTVVDGENNEMQPTQATDDDDDENDSDGNESSRHRKRITLTFWDTKITLMGLSIH